MNPQVKRYLASERALNEAEANFKLVKEQYARMIDEARIAYRQAANAHMDNGGSAAYDTGCGQFTFCAPLPDYMVEYYAKR